MNTIKDQNKILIVSKSNNVVIKSISQWLLNSKFELVKLNYDTDKFLIISLNIDHSTFKFKINDTEYDYLDFKNIYFHCGAIQLKDFTGIVSSSDNIIDFSSAFAYYRTAYEYFLQETFSNLIHQKNTIGKNQGGVINKLNVLNIAQKSGMRIPQTIVTTRKEDVSNFINIHSKIISKSLDLNFIFYDKNRSKLIHGLTSEIILADLEELPADFPLSMFQENIEKIFEIRIYFLGSKNFASAIFSQNSNNTIQDYRNYDDDFPNRVVPFILSEKFENKLLKFKELTGLKTGSIDVMVDAQNNYYFLEVNPQGQFMGISEYCNYYLEKHLANYLQE